MPGWCGPHFAATFRASVLFTNGPDAGRVDRWVPFAGEAEARAAWSEHGRALVEYRARFPKPSLTLGWARERWGEP